MFFVLTPPLKFTHAAVDCGPAPAVTNGVSLFISGTTTLNSRVNYTCESGYLLSGSLTVTCQSIGTWNLPPTCQGKHASKEIAKYNLYGSIILMHTLTKSLY